jgi:hypothetical protein
MEFAHAPDQSADYHSSLHQSPVNCGDTLDGCHIGSRMSGAQDLRSIRVLVDALHDPRARAIDESPVNLLPNIPHNGDEAFRRLLGIELELNEHVVWIADGTIQAIAPHTRTLAARWISVEGQTPGRIVANRVLNLNGYHRRTSHVSITQPRSCDARIHLAA